VIVSEIRLEARRSAIALLLRILLLFGHLPVDLVDGGLFAAPVIKNIFDSKKCY
jgi:hypothetical protein